MKKSEEVFIDHFINTILNSALGKSQNIYNSFNQAIKRGVEINKLILLENYNHLEMGYGLKAGQDINFRDEVFKIPLTTGFNGTDLIDFREDINKKLVYEISRKTAQHFHQKDKFRQEKFYQNCILAWQLILNASNQDSFNYHMVEAFPTHDLTQPVYTSQEIFNQISSKNLIKYYFDNNSFYHNLYEFMKKDSLIEVTYDEIVWAFNNVYARKILLVEESTTSPIELILPIIDYVNHSSIKHNLACEPTFDHLDKRSYLFVNATRNIKENEQLFFDYGPCTNKKFMHLYGFFDTENPKIETEFYMYGESLHKFLDIQNEPIIKQFNSYLEDSKNSEFKKNLLIKHTSISLDSEFNLILFTNKFDNNFLKFLRIILLDNEEITNNKEKIFNFNFSKQYSQENEKKVMEYILFLLKAYYIDIQNKNYKELISKLGPINSIEKYKTKNMLLLENEEKFLLEKNINYLINKTKNLLI